MLQVLDFRLSFCLGGPRVSGEDERGCARTSRSTWNRPMLRNSGIQVDLLLGGPSKLPRDPTSRVP